MGFHCFDGLQAWLQSLRSLQVLGARVGPEGPRAAFTKKSAALNCSGPGGPGGPGGPKPWACDSATPCKCCYYAIATKAEDDTLSTGWFMNAVGDWQWWHGDAPHCCAEALKEESLARRLYRKFFKGPVEPACPCCYYSYQQGWPPKCGWFVGEWSHWCQSYTWTWSHYAAPHYRGTWHVPMSHIKGTWAEYLFPPGGPDPTEAEYREICARGWEAQRRDWEDQDDDDSEGSGSGAGYYTVGPVSVEYINFYQDLNLQAMRQDPGWLAAQQDYRQLAEQSDDQILTGAYQTLEENPIWVAMHQSPTGPVDPITGPVRVGPTGPVVPALADIPIQGLLETVTEGDDERER